MGGYRIYSYCKINCINNVYASDSDSAPAAASALS